ncbi:hypothetical protein MHI18_15365 [Peribacillus sp. FSL H8-0477]
MYSHLFDGYTGNLLRRLDLSEDLMSFTGFFTILNDKLVVLHNQMTS